MYKLNAPVTFLMYSDKVVPSEHSSKAHVFSFAAFLENDEGEGGEEAARAGERNKWCAVSTG